MSAFSLRRGATVTALAASLLALALDLSRPPAAQWSNRALLAAVRGYQQRLSPRLPDRCRFQPTCSQYAVVVLRRDGALLGGARTAWRILRCGPWTPVGTVDSPEASASSSPGARTDE